MAILNRTWVREDDGEGVADVVMEVDFAMSGVDLEVWERVSDRDARHGGY